EPLNHVAIDNVLVITQQETLPDIFLSGQDSLGKSSDRAILPEMPAQKVRLQCDIPPAGNMNTSEHKIFPEGERQYLKIELPPRENTAEFRA
ncbi:unnamed protein product, partial [marine sediment metagenome]